MNQLPKIKASSYILTISETSKSEIIKLGNFNPKQVLVSYCGISETLVNNTAFNSAKNDYDLLYVATFIPRKNHINLIRALPLIGRPVKLALLGRDLGCRNKVEALTRKLSLQDSVDFFDSMSESDMATLYSRSRIFVSPSVREGFGMPVAEALAVGLPVVCSDIPVFREVAGAWAGYFDPYNPASIASELKRALDFADTSVHPMKERQLYAREKFCWDNIVEKLVAELKNL
jgi:glycosyltransferase involved in cell wall biosynthesis